jgi:hypothetical protein
MVVEKHLSNIPNADDHVWLSVSVDILKRECDAGPTG